MSVGLGTLVPALSAISALAVAFIRNREQTKRKVLEEETKRLEQREETKRARIAAEVELERIRWGVDEEVPGASLGEEETPGAT
ncbi:hypothetical protein ABT202_01375 [Streptomyces sp900105245]|uniref:hypothetical protein n=1 Tax=Streptomyces sp. 900105245 TaxID=3154379 RepID=UPI003325EEE9